MFEPLAGRFHDIDNNSLVKDIPNCSLHKVALSDQNGTCKIKILGNAGVGSSILVLASDFKKEIEIIDCEQARLDDYIINYNLPYADFIKIDAQGAELKILNGAKNALTKSKFVLAETWLRRVYGPETPLFQELVKFMAEMDYVVFELLTLDKEGRDEDGTLRWFDVVFANKNLINKPSFWY